MKKTKLFTRALNLHCIILLTIILMMLTVFGSMNVMGQASTPSLSTLPFNFTTYSGTVQPSTLKIGAGSNTTGTFTTDLSTDATNGTAAGTWQAEGAGGISFRGSSSVRPACFQVRVNASTSTNINVIWTAANLVEGANNNYLELQWRNGSSGAWNDVTGDQFSSSGNTNQTFNVVLPSGANNLADLRIRWIYYEDATGGTRDRISIDEVTVQALAPCSGTPAPGNTQSTSSNVCSGASFTLSFSGTVTGSGLTYQWQSSPNNTTWTNIAGATAATLATTQTAATYYRCQVTCSGNTGTSTALQVTMANFMTCHCVPTSTDCSLSDVITNVTLSTLNNTTGCTTGGYTDYTSGQPIPTIVKTVASSMSVTVGAGGTEYVGVYLDMDHSGTFGAGEFLLLGSGNGVTITNSVTIPGTALTGNTKMRVRVRYNTTLTASDACTAYTYGETEDYTINIVNAVNCAGTPGATTATSSVGTACYSTNFNLSLSSVPTDLGITYQWQSSPDNSTWANISGATSVPYARTGQTTSTYYRCVVTCTNSSQSANSTSVLVNQTALASCYCIPTTACASDRITDFQLNSLTKNTGAACSTSPAGYTLYASTPANQTTTLAQGASYTATISTVNTANANGTGVAIWIDYNDNGVFETSERSDNGATKFASNATGTIIVNVPVAAPLGQHRLRIMATRNSFSNAQDPCTPANANGETEDYTVTIATQASCSGTPLAGTTASSATTSCSPLSTNLSLTGATADANITYQWQSSPDNTTWANVSGATSSTYPASGLTASTYYRCELTCTNSSLSAVSTAIQVVVATCINISTGNTTTCNANFYDSQGPSVNYLNNEDYTFTIYPDPGNLVRVNFSAFSTESGFDFLSIYDGNSTAATLVGTYSGTTSPGIVTSSAADGSLTFHFTSDGSNRAAGWQSVVSCVALPTCSGAVTGGTTVPSSSAVCSGATLTLNLSGQTSGVAGITYQWQSSADNVTYSNITGATGVSYSTTFTASSWYRCLITCTASSQSDFSSAAQVTLNPFYNCYCEPSYGNSCTVDYISNVTFGTINNTTTCSGTTPSNLTSYNTPNPHFVQGSSYPLSVTTDGDTEGLNVWIDFNMNGVFDATESVMTAAAGGPPQTTTGSILFPTGAGYPTGTTKMRVRCRYNNTVANTAACTAYSTGYGETEDYLITIEANTCINAPTYPTNAGTACEDPSGVVLSWPAFAGATQYDVYFGTTPSPTTKVADDLAALSYNVGTLSTSGTYYWIIVPQIPGATTCNTWSFTVNPVPTVVLNTNSPTCEGINLSFSAANAAAGQSSGNTYSWTGPNSFSSTLQSVSVTGVASNSGLYSVTITNQFGCTASSSAQGDIAPNPTLSIGSQTDISCFGYNDGTVTVVADNGTPDYVFNDGNNFNIDGIFTGMAPGVTTIYVEDVNSCSSSIIVSINEPSAVVPVASSNSPVCINGTVNLTGSGSGGTGALSYEWSGPATFSSTLQNPSISLVALTMAGDYFLTVTDLNNCSNTVSTNVVVRDVPSAPATITGAPMSVCPPTSTYTLSTTANDADTYNWYLAPGNNGVTFISANGSSSMDVDFQATTNSGYTIRVDATNACGTSVYTPVFVRRSTSTPVAIIGDAFACANNVKTYSHAAVGGATSYQWTAPAGCFFDGNSLNVSPYVTSGTSVTVTFPSGYTSGVIGVASQVACFTSPYKNINVSNAPPVASAITGSVTVCAPQSGLAYSVTNTAGLTYTWTPPANAVIFSGQGTSSVVVNYLSGFAGGQLQVVANSACGSSIARKLNVGVSAGGGLTARPISITGPASNLCSGTNVLFTSNPLVSGATYTFTTNISGAVVNAGSAANEALITFPAGWATGQISVTQQNACASVSPARTLDVKARPATPVITGPVNIAPNSTGIAYTVPVVSPAVTYTWYAPGGATIASGQGSASVSVNFGSTGGQIKCFEVNACGNATGVLNVVSPRMASAITTQDASLNEVSVFPNPVKDILTIKLTAVEAFEAVIEMSDLSGKQLSATVIHAAERVNTYNLSVKDMARGMYLLTIRTPQGNNKSRIVVE